MELGVARTANTAVREVRRDAILDVAERLIRTKGYASMSIQDVQDELGVSRGAIYHYFRSKAELLGAVVERTADAVMEAVAPIASDPDLSAFDKLRAVFATAGRWKQERRDLTMALLQAWYADANAIAREHVRRVMTARMTPLLAGIVSQGASEGVFRVTSPDQAASILVALFVVSSDTTAQLFLDRRHRRVPFEEVERAVAAYDEAVERILGLPPGSFELVDPPTLRFWFA
jgi:AcrR family transcriptional regulator